MPHWCLSILAFIFLKQLNSSFCSSPQWMPPHCGLSAILSSSSCCCVFHFLVVLVCVFLKVASLRSLASAGIARKGNSAAFIQSHCSLAQLWWWIWGMFPLPLWHPPVCCSSTASEYMQICFQFCFTLQLKSFLLCRHQKWGRKIISKNTKYPAALLLETERMVIAVDHF